MKSIDALRTLSRVGSLPLLKLVSPAVNTEASTEAKEGHLQSQRLAYRAVKEVAKMMEEGWTERQAAEMVGTYLRDCGVRSFFHHPFAWFGERARFQGMKKNSDFLPSKRVLLPGEIFILDVAPIYRGYVSDIGYTGCLEENPTCEKAMKFLKELREEIPKLFECGISGREIWKRVEDKILEARYANSHKIYPFSVLGHRVHKTTEVHEWLKFLNFGWQSYWSLASRGLFGQLLGPFFEGDLTGLWAIEPHLGGEGFGAKFEEILVVDHGKAYWLETDPEKGWM
jgi:hypothetical protein